MHANMVAQSDHLLPGVGCPQLRAIFLLSALWPLPYLLLHPRSNWRLEVRFHSATWLKQRPLESFALV